jgi:enediyne biosynthesis protein E4
VSVAPSVGLRQKDTVLSQSSFLSQNDLRLHFGLGRATRVDGFTVRWPSGVTETFPGSEVDRLVVLVEGRGRTSTATSQQHFPRCCECSSEG